MKSKSNKGTWKNDIMMNKGVYLLFVPIAAYFIIFNYLPMFGIVMAFQNFNVTESFLGSRFVGIANFISFFTQPAFWLILRNTVVISLLGIFVGMTASIIFALLINEITYTMFKKTIQTISYMPYFISAVVMAGLIRQFVSTNGFITDILVSFFGIRRENLLLNPAYFWWINLFSDIWQGLGYGAIIYIAALTGVSQELHEAAVIDGANRFSRVWHVTLPAIRPTIVTMLVLRFGMIFSVGFEKILLIYSPSVYTTADVISTHVVRMGIERMQYGYSAAVGLFNSVVGTILLLISNAASKKLADSSIF